MKTRVPPTKLLSILLGLVCFLVRDAAAFGRVQRASKSMIASSSFLRNRDYINTYKQRYNNGPRPNDSNNNNNNRRRPTTTTASSTSSTALCYAAGHESEILDALLTAVKSVSTVKAASIMEQDVSSVLNTAGGPGGNIGAIEKDTQAAILRDMSRIALDFTHIFGEENGIAYSTAEVLGYVLGMASDYEVDQQIEPGQLVFNGFMLSAAAVALKDSVVSMSLSAATAAATKERVLTYRERKAYELLFAPVGIKRSHFDALLSSETLDWVTVEPGTVISAHNTDDEECPITYDMTVDEECESDDDYIYWLYKGWVEVDMEGNDGVRSYPRVSRLDVGLGLIGEMSLTRRIEKEFIEANAEEGTMTMYHPPMVVRAGGCSKRKGTQLLRMNTRKLMELLNDDDELCHSIHLLLIMGMQDKLYALMKFTDIDDCEVETCPVF